MNDQKLYPISLPQEAFYFDYLLHHDDCKYNMGGVFFLEGDLNIDVYRDAYRYVTTQYDAMRVRFVRREALLYQEFRPVYECPIRYADFRGHGNPVEDALELILKEYRKPVPIESDHLISELIVQTADRQFLLGPKFHHLVYDAMGRSVINSAVSAVYNSLMETGEYPALKPFSYLDFIQDDLQYRVSDDYKVSAEFWKRKFERLPEPFPFTSKKKSIKNISLHTEQLALNLHRICFESIVTIAFESGVTTFQVILGLLAAALYRCYHRNDMVIGMPVLNRSNHQFRNTPGLFMNMMGLRLRIDAGGTFADLLRTIKSEIREGYRHQRFPLRDTIRHLRSSAEFNNELFDVTIIYRKNDYSQRFGEGKIHAITADTGIRSESLSIEIDEYDEGENVNIFFNYNPLVFAEDELVQLIRGFETLLLDVISFPDKTLAELTLLNEFEVHAILNEFNVTADVLPAEETIVAAFEQAAARWPDAPAVICNTAELSYRELNERANRVAGYLLANFPMGPEKIVCLAARRSIDAIAAMIGIMKTGAALLPIDIDHPVERIRFIVTDSGADMVLTDGPLDPTVASHVVHMSGITSAADDNPALPIGLEHLAYVIYTSGSTGTPKGVMIEHGQFMHMFVNMIGKFGVKKTDRVLQFASLGFDAAVFEIFQALLTGAALVIAEKETVRDPAAFVEYCGAHKVTVATLPPAYLRVLDKAELPYIHTLITAGDQAVPDDVNFYKQTKRYINAYGPTEASVCASYHVAENGKEYSGCVPIGKPSPQSKLYILDDDLALVPVGFAGELCISGPSLARGYLNNEALTRQKFVPHPFEAGARLYRTGDRARWRADGTIEFLGRVDEQVKINGNRIELGEIEAQLSKYDKIRAVAVLDVPAGGTKELAAFIAAEGPIDLNSLKQYLRKFLPEYMIPLRFCVIDRIPLTQNGKVNKDALRHMPLTAARENRPVSVGSNDTELRLIRLFEEVLDVRPVGIDDNIFELGGDSLKIARLIAKIHKELRRRIDFKVFFDCPSVRSIAAELETYAVIGYEEIPAVPHKEYYPLSHAQKRLWVLAQNREQAAVYHMPVVLRIDGPLHVEALRHSLRALVQRHEALRTVFNDVNGIPFQRVPDDYTFDVTIEDAGGQDVRTLIRDRISAPFDLTRDIPIRASIVRLEEEQHILLLVMHHIAGDGISIGILMKELSGLYRAFRNRTAMNLKPLRIQYKEYCEYEKELVESRKYSDEKQYWVNKLRHPLPVLELSYDRPRPPVKTYAGDYVFYELDSRLSQEVFAFCKEQNVSLFVFLVAIVNILLHKYSSQEEIIVGSPVAGRNHPDLEDQVGVYINTVALRNAINSADSSIAFLNDVRLNTAEALSHSDYPFDRLIQALNLDRDTSHTPLFDVLVQFQNQNPAALQLDDVSATMFDAEFKYNKFDLTFTFLEEDRRIQFSIGYNTDLFNRERIDRASRHLRTIIASFLEHPARAIKEIDLLDDAEKASLDAMASGTRREFDATATIRDVFAAQVRRTPARTALVYNDVALTYAELDARANAVACRIRRAIAVHPDDIIGIMTGRSELMVIGMLGILKAGAAYLPIDPGYPSDRIAFMLEDSAAKLLLTETVLQDAAAASAHAHGPEGGRTIPVLDIALPHEADRSDPDRSGPDQCEPETTLGASNLVYVIYTSGSTGRPKGVMIEHRSLHNLVLGLGDDIYGTGTAPMNIALIAPFVFDASVKQIFFALLNGHCLDIVPDGMKTSGRKLLAYYEAHRIAVSDGTPLHLEIITDDLRPGAGQYLPERFLIGGQQLMTQTVKKFYAAAGRHAPSITNVYGPTECCDVSACFTLDQRTVMHADGSFPVLPVGTPLPNVEIRILDSNRARVPVGVNGELYIAGEGLARGYVNRADLTAERFIAVGPNAKRMYKTGDIGRYRADGTIILSGRSDDQIKLRGFRIELGEIEHCMRQHPAVHSAAVVTIDEGGDQEIAAYYCVSESIGADDLRRFAALHLPGYMIPAYFVELKNLPLTRNGKIDKRALPRPVKEQPTPETAVRPADKLEEKLCGIWMELLLLEKIDVTGNFFALGGHSLIAIRLTSRIHKEFNIEINIWEVFQYPTVRSLAGLIRSKHPSLFNPIETIEPRDAYPLSHAQRRMWFLAKLDGQNSLYNLPGAFILKGPLDIPAFESAFKAIVRRHESLRTSFIEIDGEPLQHIAETVDFTIAVEEYAGGTWDHRMLQQLADKEFQMEFDLSRAPLLKAKLVILSAEQHLLLFNMHHIISDGWSMEVLMRELAAFYEALLTKNEAPVPPLRIQYKDYVAWQNAMLSECSLQPMKEYWQKKLHKPHPLLDLPSDFKRTDSFSIDGELIWFSIAEAPMKAITELSRAQNASVFMALLSIVYILLHKYTGEEDIMIGSPIAGRQHSDLDDQIGYFINTLVLRTEINPEHSFLDVLNAVKETLRGAFDNQVYPFDRLVDELEVERIPNRNPFFDVMVAWMVTNGMGMTFTFSGIEATGLDFRIPKSMFDLSFLFEERDGKVSYGIEYNTSLFKHERIERMSDHLQRLIDAIAEAPKERIRNIQLVSGREKDKHLFEFNTPAAVNAEPTPVVASFREQAAAHARAIAVVAGDATMTYGELDAVSDRIAAHLIERAAPKKDDIIAVIIDDPLLATASLLGVMKTGAAYLPILSDTPRERVSFIVRDSAAAVVVTDGITDRPEGSASGPVFIDVRTIIGPHRTIPACPVEPDSLAYVIYTSGSTGRPKGVMIDHRALANLIASLDERVYSRYPRGLHELMVSSFAFDVSLKQIFGVLTTGNTLHILSAEKRRDPREIAGYIVANNINIADLTPSVFSVMLEEGFAEMNKPHLREIFLGSEALPFKLVRQFYSVARNKEIHLTNFYGPTECCVESAAFPLHPEMVDEPYDITPIGTAITSEQIYILDRFLNLCPVGVPGEICIAGTGLARRYLNDPAMTAEKFVLFPSLPGVRIYRTGDAGRTLRDGTIEFLGRMDEQVKLRGYRVELQEIEQSLRGIDEIKDCAVILHEHNGMSDLAAYYTSDTVLDEKRIAAHLARFLPSYMIPAYYMQLENIPLSSNGKADKKHLPVPGERPAKEKRRTANDDIEALILRICSTVLKNEEISLDDNFFEIGGHSLNAVRLLSQIQKEVHVELTLKDIFYHPILIDIIEIVKNHIAERPSVGMQPADAAAIVPMTDDELALLSTLSNDDEA